MPAGGYRDVGTETAQSGPWQGCPPKELCGQRRPGTGLSDGCMEVFREEVG